EPEVRPRAIAQVLVAGANCRAQPAGISGESPAKAVTPDDLRLAGSRRPPPPLACLFATLPSQTPPGETSRPHRSCAATAARHHQGAGPLWRLGRRHDRRFWSARRRLRESGRPQERLLSALAAAQPQVRQSAALDLRATGNTASRTAAKPDLR